MNKQPTIRKRVVENWETIAVTPLPLGWVNVFKQDDGTEVAVPCPGVLLQELRSVTHCVDELDAEGRAVDMKFTEETLEPPYQTRAEAGDFEGGWMCVASDTGNYLRTVTEDYVGQVMERLPVRTQDVDRTLGHEVDNEDDWDGPW